MQMPFTNNEDSGGIAMAFMVYNIAKEEQWLQDSGYDNIKINVPMY